MAIRVGARRIGWSILFALAVLPGPIAGLYAQPASPHVLDLTTDADDEQYRFLSPTLRDVEVVSLAESIHMTHEFPVVRIGMVRWLHEHLGFDMLAMEGSPEDLWVSQDAFLHHPADIAHSTSGLFGVWNTGEMRQLFAYEAATWHSGHPLYITAYDIQPGTGQGSRGLRVFELLAQALSGYAAAPPGFQQDAWLADLRPLTNACGLFKAEDATKVGEAIDVLQQWIDRAAPNADAAFPNLPHGTVLRLIPENLRASLRLCEGYASGGSSGSALYKTTRDKNAAQFALRLKEVAPAQRLMLWAHVSHLFYDAEASSTSVGEILHASLGNRLYTVGVFAESGGALMLFSDWNDIIGYGRVWGVSRRLKQRLDGGCPSVCFYDLRNAGGDAVLSQRQWVWFEAVPHRMALSKDFDGIVWVRTVHPPGMGFSELLEYGTRRYWLGVAMVALMLLLFMGVLWLVARRVNGRFRRRRLLGSQGMGD